MAKLSFRSWRSVLLVITVLAAVGIGSVWYRGAQGRDALRNLVNDEQVVTQDEAITSVKADLARRLNIQPDSIKVEYIDESEVNDLDPKAEFPDCPPNASCMGPTTAGYEVLLSAKDTFYTYIANKYYAPGIEKRADSLPRKAVNTAKQHLSRHLKVDTTAIQPTGGSYTSAVFIDCPSLENCKREDGYAVHLIHQDTEYYYKISTDLKRVELGDSRPKR